MNIHRIDETGPNTTITPTPSDGRDHPDGAATTGRRRPIRHVTLAAGSGLALAVLAACGSSGGSGPAGSTAASPAGASEGPTRPSTSAPAAGPSAPAAGTTAAMPTSPNQPRGADRLAAAGATARDELGRGTVTSIDLERGGTVWEVEITTGDGAEHEVRISRDGSTVVSGPRTEPQSARDKQENRRELRAAKLDYRRAAQKILAARTGTIAELNLDDRRGAAVWEADVIHAGTKYEVVVDAATGDVLVDRADRDGDD